MEHLGSNVAVHIADIPRRAPGLEGLRLLLCLWYIGLGFWFRLKVSEVLNMYSEVRAPWLHPKMLSVMLC